MNRPTMPTDATRIARPCLALLVVLLVGCKRHAEWENQHGPDVIQTATGIMVSLPSGSFQMGSDRGDPDEGPAHDVRVDAFLMDRCEVTQAQFKELMGRNPSHFKDADFPVEQVSWGDAALYCNARSRAEGLQPCYDEETAECDFEADGYRLPTEAEWEYACRAGSNDAYSFGNDPRRLSANGWFRDNAAGRPHPVGTGRPNAWGLYDMHGNVFEWCNDVYDANYYGAAPAENPRGPNETPMSQFVLRGGAWDSTAQACRSTYRTGEDPGQIDGCFRRNNVGFRCVRRPKRSTE